MLHIASTQLEKMIPGFYSSELKALSIKNHMAHYTVLSWKYILIFYHC